MPEAIPGLFFGCIFANFFGGYGLPDMVFGSLATLIAAILSRKSSNLWIAALWPVVSNMVIIGVMLHVLVEAPLMLTCLYVGLGEAGACWLVGIPLMKVLSARKIITRAKGV